jgi:GH15 family glucan-1,4-alpha-glucosidase
MTEKGGLTITDFMPVDGDISTRGSSSAQPEIHRLIECEGDDIEIRVEWSPRFDYSRSLMQIKKANNGYLATDGKNKLSLSA